MPDLDVSDVLFDPMLSTTFDVVREAESVDSKGRTVQTPTTFSAVVGVITQEDPADLIKLPESEMVPRRIFGATTFAVRGATTGFQPDKIVYAGDTYTVTRVMPYSRYGPGIFEFIATSMNATDNPITNSS